MHFPRAGGVTGGAKRNPCLQDVRFGFMFASENPCTTGTVARNTIGGGEKESE